MDGHLAIGTALVILVAKAHFALTTALYETLRSYRLLKKFKKLSSYAPNFHCLIHMLYLVVVLLRIDVFRILTVVPLLP